MKRSEGGHSLISPSSSSSSTPLMYRTLLHLCRWNTVITIGCSFKGTDTDLIVHMIYFGTNESVIMMKQVYSWRLLKKDKEKEGTPLCLFWNKAALITIGGFSFPTGSHSAAADLNLSLSERFLAAEYLNCLSFKRIFRHFNACFFKGRKILTILFVTGRITKKKKIKYATNIVKVKNKPDENFTQMTSQRSVYIFFCVCQLSVEKHVTC